MDTLEVLLYPIVVAMGFVFEMLHGALGSYGLAIIGTSAVVRLVMYPIIKASLRLEEKERRTQLAMAPAIASATATLSGRARFEAIDAIYQTHGYHPIKSLITLVPLLLQIPFLLGALHLFVDYPALVAAKFLIIDDLSKPDQLVRLGTLAINVLPIALAAIAVLDSALNRNATRQARWRFLVVTAVLLVLIYPLPAAVCLYWLTSNVWSLARTLVARAKVAV